jgi:hypothetical protein
MVHSLAPITGRATSRFIAAGFSVSASEKRFILPRVRAVTVTVDEYGYGKGKAVMMSGVDSLGAMRAARKKIARDAVRRIAAWDNWLQRLASRAAAHVASIAIETIARLGGGWRRHEGALAGQPRPVRIRVDGRGSCRRADRGRGDWGHRWVSAKASMDNLDVKLLMWNMRRNMNPDPMPPGRSVIQIIFRDLPTTTRKLVADRRA